MYYSDNELEEAQVIKETKNSAMNRVMMPLVLPQQRLFKLQEEHSGFNSTGHFELLERQHKYTGSFSISCDQSLCSIEP